MRLLTNQIIDQKLINRPIKRLDDCINSQTHIKWQCLKANCNYIWKAIPNNILRGRGCPKCAGKLVLTNEIIDGRLKERKIKRLDNFVNSKLIMKWQCLEQNCQHIWKTTSGSVVSAESGCPKCAQHNNLQRIMETKLTNESVDARLSGRFIRRIENYVNFFTKIKFQCLIDGCGYIWDALPSNVLHHLHGCPKCAGNIELTDEIIDSRIEGKKIQRLEHCVGAHQTIKWQCMIDGCGHIWIANPNNILNNQTGCPNCGRKKGAELRKYSLQEFIDRANEIHNNKYDYSKSQYSNIYLPLTIICPIHGEFLQVPNNHLQGRECSACGIPGKNERLIYEWLVKNSVNFEHNYHISKIDKKIKNKWNVDFYIPNINLILKYNGEQHYFPRKFGSSMSDEEAKNRLKKQKSRDKYIDKWAQKHQIKLIWIDGRKCFGTVLEKYLEKEILPLLIKSG